MGGPDLSEKMTLKWIPEKEAELAKEQWKESSWERGRVT